MRYLKTGSAMAMGLAAMAGLLSGCGGSSSSTSTNTGSTYNSAIAGNYTGTFNLEESNGTAVTGSDKVTIDAFGNLTGQLTPSGGSGNLALTGVIMANQSFSGNLGTTSGLIPFTGSFGTLTGEQLTGTMQSTTGEQLGLTLTQN